MLLAVSLLGFARTSIDRINYDKNRQMRQKTRGITSTATDAGSKVENEQSRGRTSAALIQKAYEHFKYRDVIPLLHETLVSVLTNEKNNPEQKELYKSFDDDDIKAVLKIPRKERKQIFVTSASIYFSEDVGTAQFKNVEFLRAGSSKRRSGGASGPEGADAYQEEMMRMMQEMGYDMGAQQPRYERRQRTPGSEEGDGTETESEGEEGAGFLVNITGYCPYETIGELLDPAGVGDDQSKWGIITRLMNLNDINDGNSPFSLYKRTEFAHFSLETGEVDLNSEMPTGIGSEEVITRRIEGNEVEELVLVDPMTKEVISKLSELD